MADQEPVLFNLISARGGYKLATVALNRPSAGNALDLDMIERLLVRLKRWRASKKIAAVLVYGEGRSGFCSGMDLSEIFLNPDLDEEQRFEKVEKYQRKKYELIQLLHKFNRPLIVWGAGAIKGNGAGLFLSASHRIGTSTLAMSWPEARFGFFPDLFGSYHLSRLPQPLGLWLALTGLPLNAVDSKFLSLTSHCMPQEAMGWLIEDLRRLPWSSNFAMNHALVRDSIAVLEVDCSGEDFSSHVQTPGLTADWQEIATRLSRLLSQRPDGEDLLSWIGSFQKMEEKWVDTGIESSRLAWPSAGESISDLLQKAQHMSLSEVVELESGFARRMIGSPLFSEGMDKQLGKQEQTAPWRNCLPETV